MKKFIENAVRSHSGRNDQAEERISKLEDRSFEIDESGFCLVFLWSLHFSVEGIRRDGGFLARR